jgi:hypothetical protein
MEKVSALLLISTLNISGLNYPFKRQEMTEKNYNPTNAMEKRHFQIKDRNRLQVKSCQKMYHVTAAI